MRDPASLPSWPGTSSSGSSVAMPLDRTTAGAVWVSRSVTRSSWRTAAASGSMLARAPGDPSPSGSPAMESLALRRSEEGPAMPGPPRAGLSGSSLPFELVVDVPCRVLVAAGAVRLAGRSAARLGRPLTAGLAGGVGAAVGGGLISCLDAVRVGTGTRTRRRDGRSVLPLHRGLGEGRPADRRQCHHRDHRDRYPLHPHPYHLPHRLPDSVRADDEVPVKAG